MLLFSQGRLFGRRVVCRGSNRPRAQAPNFVFHHANVPDVALWPSHRPPFDASGSRRPSPLDVVQGSRTESRCGNVGGYTNRQIRSRVKEDGAIPANACRLGSADDGLPFKVSIYLAGNWR